MLLGEQDSGIECLADDKAGDMLKITEHSGGGESQVDLCEFYQGADEERAISARMDIWPMAERFYLIPM